MDSLFGTLQKPEDIFKEDWVVQPSDSVVNYSRLLPYMFTLLKVSFCLICYFSILVGDNMVHI
jgi:hypothetical protein